MRRRFRAACLLALPAVVWGEPGFLQIHVTKGQGAVYLAGSRVQSPVEVRITDELGRPAADASVSFQIANYPATGFFQNGLNTELVTTDRDGHAAAPPVRWGKTPGTVQFRVTAQKDQARAGTILDQELTLNPQAATRLQRRGRSKWIALSILLAGAGVGFATGRSSSGQASAGAPSPPPVTIGAPSISIGGPQ